MPNPGILLVALASVCAMAGADPLPPALPFAYGGSGVVNGRAVLFLERQNQSVPVHVGDVVQGLYRIEALERNHAVLRYLPLDVPQVMAYRSPGLPEPLVATFPPPAQGPLFVNLPDEAPLGQEVQVALGIPPGSPAARATIELTYDAAVLSVTGARIVRPGRALIEVSKADPAGSKQIRLKAIAEETVLTEIGIEVTALDAYGKSIAVAIPAQHLISLVTK
jgi:hypothetical protein